MSEESISYSVRPSIKKEVFTYTLEDDALHVTSDKGKDTRVFYRDISKINITFANQGVYKCCIYPVSGDNIKIGSHSFAGWGTTDNQIDTFVLFIEELHNNLEDYSDTITFTRGSTSTFYAIAITLGLLLLFLLIVVPFAIIEGKLMDIILYVIIGFVVIISMGTGLLPKLKPKRYDPVKDGLPYSMSKAAELFRKSKQEEKNE